MSDAPNIHAALMAIQQGLRAPKDKSAQGARYRYRSAEDILEAVKPLLAKHGLTLVLRDEAVMVGDRYYIKAMAEICDGAAKLCCSSLAREDEKRPGISESQSTGCAVSYARKYALCGLFAIDDSAQDPDGLPPPPPPQKAATPQAQAPKPLDSKVVQEIRAAKTVEELNAVAKTWFPNSAGIGPYLPEFKERKAALVGGAK